MSKLGTYNISYRIFIFFCYNPTAFLRIARPQMKSTHQAKIINGSIQLIFLFSVILFFGQATYSSEACLNYYSSQNIEIDKFAGKKSPLAPKPLPIRLVKNIYRWYFKKDTRIKSDLIKETDYNYLSDLDYLKEKRQQDRLGIVKSFFSEDFDTRIYYTATGKPDSSGKIPIVNPNSKGLYFYFHGSGTNKASGANFSYKMNRLAAMGYSVISIDLPYHSDGTRNRQSQRADYFYSELKKLIHTYAIEGMPVYLAGHSFGPEIATEYFARFPYDPYVKGVLGISPASFNDILEDWFMNKTAHMTALWGDMVTNDDGAAWAGLISSQHIWKKSRSQGIQDPTELNPNFKLHFISGEYEEYAPGKLDHRGLPTKEKRDYSICKALLALFKNSKCTTEAGVGHYIFEHKDSNGHDVILRELLDLDGESLDNEKKLKAQAAEINKVDDLYEFVKKFARDNAFRNYVIVKYEGQTTIETALSNNDISLARKIINEYTKYIVTQRDAAMAKNILSTKVWAPDFYNENKAEIDSIDLKKPRPSDSLLNKYFGLLEHSPNDIVEVFATVHDSVLDLPVKKAPSAEVLERQRLIDLEKKEKNKKQTIPGAA